MIEKNFSGKNTTATVFSADALSGELSEFFLKFETGNLKIYPMDSVKIINKGPLYFLLNRQISPATARKADSLITRDKDSSIFVIYQKNNVSLYKVNNTVLQILNKN